MNAHAGQTAIDSTFICAVIAALGCGPEVPRYDQPPWSDEPVTVGSLSGRIVVSNSGEDSLSVVDPAMSVAPGRLPVGLNPVDLETPRGLAADLRGRFLYVNFIVPLPDADSGPHGGHGADGQPGYIIKLEAATARAVGWMPVDRDPADSVLTADGKTLFVTHYDLIAWAHGSGHVADPSLRNSNLTVIDTESMVVRAQFPLCPAAKGVRLSSDERTLYATCTSDEIAMVDLTATPPAVKRVPLISPEATVRENCARCPYALAVAPDGLVWIADVGPNVGSSGMGSVTVFDPKVGAFDQTQIAWLPGRAMSVAFASSPNGYRALVVEQAAGQDLERLHAYGAPVGSAPIPEMASASMTPADCARARAVTVAPDELAAYLICEGNHSAPGSLVWFDLAPLTMKKSAALGLFPDGIVLVPSVQ
jgi:hypothetical protein